MLCCKRAPWAGQGNALGASQPPPPPPLGVDQLLGSGFDSFIIFILFLIKEIVSFSRIIK